MRSIDAIGSYSSPKVLCATGAGRSQQRLLTTSSLLQQEERTLSTTWSQRAVHATAVEVPHQLSDPRQSLVSLYAGK